MKDEEKSKEQLISEVIELRQRIEHLEALYSDQKGVGERLRESDEKYENFMEEAPIAICNIDVNGKVTYINRRFEKLSGYSREEIVDKYRIKLGMFPPETLKIFEGHINGKLRSEPAPLVETQFKCKDGKWIWLEVEARPIEKGGNLVGLQLAARDFTERKQMVEALRENEERLKTIFDFAPDAFFLNDMKGIFLDVNRSTEEITGYNKHELIGKNFLASRLLSPSQISRAAEFLVKSAMGKATGPDEFTLTRKDGSEVVVEIRTFPMKIKNRDLAVGIARDVTVRKRAEDALQKIRDDLEERVEERTAELSSANAILKREITKRKHAEERLKEGEEKYRNIFESIEEGYYEVDLAGNLTFFNTSLCNSYGYTNEELAGMNYRRYMDHETAINVYQVFNEVYNTGKSVEEFDCEIIRKDSAKRHMRVNVSLIKDTEGHRTGFRGIVRDLTEKKLIDSEKNFLQSIFESSIDCITVTDLDGNALYVSPSVKNILCYDENEIVGKKIEFLFGNGVEDAKKIMKELSSKGELRNHEIKARKRDGQLIDISLSASYLRDKKGEVVGALVIYRDVTEKNILKAQVQHALKMEAIGTLAGGISHHFNNLLMGIQGNASLVLLDIHSSHPHYEKLKEIEQFVQNGANLTNQLLTFSKGGKNEFRPTNLNGLLKKSAEMFGSRRKEITIHSKYLEDTWAVEIDQEQIERVLFTLYENAWEAMPGGGDLYLETENVALDEYFVKPYDLEPGNYVKISVRDTGLGMDNATKERVFEPFFTTKEVGKGTGLSLASAYGIIRSHSGIINVYSKESEGTTFNIYLPAFGKGAIVEKRLPSEILKGTETILLVDDEDIVIDIGKQLLERMGYIVLIAKSGKEAITVYKENIGEIDMVILDIIMPDMGGGETYDRLKEINPGVKVLLTSGYSIDGEATEIMERGCDGFIQKPLSMKELSQRIREILNKDQMVD